MTDDIRKRLGLDFMKKATKKFARKTDKYLDEYLQDALLTFAPRVMENMKVRPDRTTTAFHLVDELGESVSTLAPVLEHLRAQGYVDLVVAIAGTGVEAELVALRLPDPE